MIPKNCYLFLTWLMIVLLPHGTATIGEGPEMISWHYQDKNGAISYSIMDGGFLRVTCKCYGEYISLYSTGAIYALQVHLCANRTDGTFTFTLNFTDEFPYGFFTCWSDNIHSVNGVDISYRMCEPQSDQCKEPCDAYPYPKFCIRNSSYPEGISCTHPMNDACAYSNFNASRYCPDDVNICMAMKNGIVRYLAEYVYTKCESFDYMAIAYVLGHRPHYLEQVVMDNVNNTYTFTCPEGCAFRNWRAVLHVTHNLVTAYRNDTGRCPVTYILPYDYLSRRAPVSFHAVGSLEPDDRDLPKIDPPKAAIFRNQIVIFKRNINVTKIYDKNNYTTDIIIERPSFNQNEFVVEVKAFLDDVAVAIKLEGFAYKFKVEKPGLLSVKLIQTYFSCVPHRARLGPSVEQLVDILPQEIAPTTTSTTTTTTTSTTTTTTTTTTTPTTSSKSTTTTQPFAVISNKDSSPKDLSSNVSAPTISSQVTETMADMANSTTADNITGEIGAAKLPGKDGRRSEHRNNKWAGLSLIPTWFLYFLAALIGGVLLVITVVVVGRNRPGKGANIRRSHSDRGMRMKLSKRGVKPTKTKGENEFDFNTAIKIVDNRSKRSGARDAKNRKSPMNSSSKSIEKSHQSKSLSKSLQKQSTIMWKKSVKPFEKNSTKLSANQVKSVAHSSEISGASSGISSSKVSKKSVSGVYDSVDSRSKTQSSLAKSQNVPLTNVSKPSLKSDQKDSTTSYQKFLPSFLTIKTVKKSNKSDIDSSDRESANKSTSQKRKRNDSSAIDRKSSKISRKAPKLFRKSIQPDSSKRSKKTVPKLIKNKVSKVSKTNSLKSASVSERPKKPKTTRTKATLSKHSLKSFSIFSNKNSQLLTKSSSESSSKHSQPSSSKYSQKSDSNFSRTNPVSTPISLPKVSQKS